MQLRKRMLPIHGIGPMTPSPWSIYQMKFLRISTHLPVQWHINLSHLRLRLLCRSICFALGFFRGCLSFTLELLSLRFRFLAGYSGGICNGVFCFD